MMIYFFGFWLQVKQYIKTDEWLLTCTDANWFKWAGIHEDIPVIDDDNKDCNDLSNEIEDYLTK